MSAAMLEAALRYAMLGWPVFPVHEPIGIGACSCHRGARCGRDCGKHPRTLHGLSDATIAVQRIHSWWASWPDANIGLCTGNGLYVIDVDGEAGAWSLAELSELPPTVEATTGRGRHLYFRTDSPLRSTKGALGRGIDTRGEGGYVIAPPSVHATGVAYEWVRAPWACELAWLPEELRAHRCAVPQDATGGTAQRTRSALGGPDVSRSGADAMRAIALVQRGATDDEIARALAIESAKYADKLTHGARAEEYLWLTIAWARQFHARGLVRATVMRARVELLPARDGLRALNSVWLKLRTSVGECFWARVTIPSPGREQAIETYDAVLGDVDTAAWLSAAPPLGGLTGRIIDVARRGRHVVWMRAVGGESNAVAPVAASTEGKREP